MQVGRWIGVDGTMCKKGGGMNNSGITTVYADDK